MLIKSIFSLSFILLICVSSLLAQKTYTPAKGSAERAAIMSALRAPVEKKLKQKIQFSTEHIKVQGNWAFLSGSLLSESFGEPDYSKTEYKETIDAGAFDNNFFALLKKTGGKWKVIIYMIGCTDVCYLPWAKDYKAPKAIFPSSE